MVEISNLIPNLGVADGADINEYLTNINEPEVLYPFFPFFVFFNFNFLEHITSDFL